MSLDYDDKIVDLTQFKNTVCI